VVAAPAIVQDRRVAPQTARGPKRITLLGATGSIGRSTIDVVMEQRGRFSIETVAANSNAAKLAEIARTVGARLAVVADPGGYAVLKAELSGTGIVAEAGPAAVEAAAAAPADLVVAAIVGAAGLAPTLAAIRAGRDVALANKESLVSAGSLFIRWAREAGVHVLPVDSEHNAVFQTLEQRNAAEIEKIVLTASGGPFRDRNKWPLSALATARPADALKHPNWSMGPKVSIDSSTMMNKGLEVIEAHHLFSVPPERLEVLVHAQSVVHGIVAYSDGSMIAQLSTPDMRVPIAYCLDWPDRQPTRANRLDLAALGALTFEKPDLERFPALRIARAALDLGDWATNILNAANEVAVSAYLGGAIGFLEIARVAEETLEVAAGRNWAEPDSVEAALALDAEGRRIAGSLIGQD
jgi:1-deoxy-D-xylulose-5-phosphate reductoisomerase